MKRKTAAYPRARHTGGSQTLEPNSVWNIPEGVSEVRGEIKHSRFPFASYIGFRALAMDGDGYVYGVRSLTNCREDGYCLAGQVSIDGRKYRAFTSSTLFQRQDGSLCDVAVIHVCKGDVAIPLPNLDTAEDSVLEELSSRYHYDREGSRKLIHEYAMYSLWLRKGTYPHMADRYRETLEGIYAALPQWAKFRDQEPKTAQEAK